MANDYTSITSVLLTELTAGLASYSPLEVERRFWDAGKLPDFERYLVMISPPLQNAWEERVIGVRNFQYILQIDLYLMVKNFDDKVSIFGDTAPNKGIFQLVSDVKDLLRTSNLGGLLDKTYSEPAGPLSIEYAASAGFDSGEHSFIRRAKLVYTARTAAFCWPVTL
jgi:hypothetical protein